ncbi:MAG: hypothetical protein HEQ21_07615 [Blastomonas sp.]|uniref:hypothetical protein n=1 Tax=Blastomonas sp. TaxID=1909299 RepID=UPI0025878A33|nr:hypothetical protein [Blastomonas sp.]MCO5792671.1 hypothetical protein [Blastomonas sp.]
MLAQPFFDGLLCEGDHIFEERQRISYCDRDLISVLQGVVLLIHPLPSCRSCPASPQGILFEPTGPFSNRCLARLYTSLDNGRLEDALLTDRFVVFRRQLLS